MKSAHCATLGKANPYALKLRQQSKLQVLTGIDSDSRINRPLNDDSLEPNTRDLTQVLLVLGDVPAQLIDYLL